MAVPTNTTDAVKSASETRNGTSCFVFDDTAIKVFRVLSYCIIILVSLIGNSFLIGFLWQKRRKKNMNCLIANMATADLLITLIYMPRMVAMVTQGYEWLVGGTAGLVLCKMTAFSHYVALLVSIQTLVALSLERFLVVVSPFKIPFTIRRVKLIIVVIWLVAIIARLPLLVSLQTENTKYGQLRCRDKLNLLTGNPKAREVYDGVLNVVFYSFPVLIIIVFYSAVAFKLKKTNYPLNEPGGHNYGENELTAKRNKRVSLMLLTITLAFILCWGTYFIARKGVLRVQPIPCNVMFIRNFLAHLNCAVTPCIYAMFTESYRAALKKTFCCSCLQRDSNVATDNRETVILRNIRPLWLPSQANAETTS